MAIPRHVSRHPVLAQAERHEDKDLQVRVNARRVYWASQVEIPHGIAYENFDLVERFHSNCPFCFGITRNPPNALANLNRR
ncbi:MAG: hypothetical protein ACUVRT_03675 [Armatimonadota bacterium]